MKSVRQLTVYQRFDNVEFKEGEYSEIKLRGHWLNKAGFNPFDKIEVQIEQGKLIITNQRRVSHE